LRRARLLTPETCYDKAENSEHDELRKLNSHSAEENKSGVVNLCWRNAERYSVTCQMKHCGKRKT
jgi:hypothetical protein